MSQLMFNRSLTVEIINEAYTITCSDFSIDFDITLTGEAEYNTARISIRNLSEQSRTDIADTIKKGIRKLKVWGGYTGFSTTMTAMDIDLGFVPGEMLFYGDLVKIKNRKEPLGWITEIEALDGYDSIKQLSYVKTWKAGTPIQAILLDMCGSIGLPIDPGFLPLTQVLKKSASYNDPVSTVLNKICKAFNLKWAIIHGVLEINNKDTPLLSAATQVVKLTPDTGLIGSPELMVDESPESGEPTGSIIATSLLNGKLIPKRPVLILPTNPMSFAGIELAKQKRLSGFNVAAKGIYLIDTVHHSGNNRSGQFHTEITCPIWQ